MTRTAVFIAAAVAAFLGLLGKKKRHKFRRLHERPETAFVIEMGKAACRPSDPRPLVRRNGGAVKWHITNRCGAPYDVELRNFRAKRPDGTLGPVEVVTEPSVPKGTIGTATGTITARVAKSNIPTNGQMYKYEIWLAPHGQTVQLGRDPDFEIWP